MQRPIQRPIRFKTTDTELSKTKDYQTAIQIIQELTNIGVIGRSGGYCLSMSDMIKTLLEQKGIKSHLEECKLTIVGIDPPGMAIIGQTGLIHRASDLPQQLDTHVICVTDTEIPMIIDLSVNGFRDDIPYVCERLNGEKQCLAELDFGTSRWIYQRKDSARLANLYQTSILERIETDRKVKRQINFLMTAMIAVAIIAGVNAVRGAYDFYTTYIDKENYWGPTHIRELIEKVDRLEDLMKLPQDQRRQ